MTYSDIYAYCIGQCGVKPAEYWRLSEAETHGIIAGHQRLKSYSAENFRNIYGAIVRFMGEKKDVRTLWPLPTDYDNGVEYTSEYLKERNDKALILADKLGIFKN